MVVKLFVEAYLRVMLGGTVDVLIERSLKNGVLALVLHTAVKMILHSFDRISITSAKTRAQPWEAHSLKHAL
jgi:hypothetical protein